ncbi:hypothetical protein KCP73_10570 [Salmonella enterica subsp. enterica]|nr:hypothetical protein KCP73_10570 [Salmonella enterica subsp. enterica]
MAPETNHQNHASAGAWMKDVMFIDAGKVYAGAGLLRDTIQNVGGLGDTRRTKWRRVT